MGFDYARDAAGIVTVTMDMDGQSANTMSEAYHNLMGATVARLEAEAGLTGVIIASAKKTFFAGGELNTLLARGPADDAYRAWLNEDKGYFRRLERLPVPVVAAINGAALGGGFEIALACNHRIIVDDPAAITGLPEVTLGLLPGAGGAARLPRLIPLPDALELLLSGRAVPPQEALALGMVDAIVAGRDGLIPAAIAWIKANPDAGLQPWDRDPAPLTEAEMIAARAAVAAAAADVQKRTRGKMPGPKKIIEIVEAGLVLDIDATLALESRLFCDLIGLPETRAAISTNFFAANAIRSGKLRPEGARAKAGSVAVLGAGLMGAGIAHVTAARGLETWITDRSPALAQQGRAAAIAQSKAASDDIARHLHAIPALSDQAPEVIVEAVFEDVDVKLDVIRETFPRLAEGGFYATNTSTIPVALLAEAAQDPSRFVGLHFFSPVPKMPLVEIIEGPQTSPDTLRRAYDFVQQLRKTPIIVKDSRGFFTSRVFSTYLNESLELLVDGMDPLAIEQAAVDAGMPMPPFRLHDDVMISLNHAAYETHRKIDARLGVEDGFPVPNRPLRRIAREMTELGRPGRKAGRGFYDYIDGQPPKIWDGLSRFREQDHDIPQAEAEDRILYVQAIETLRCLNEGILRNEAEANLGSILGIGFPRHTGGTLQFIRGVGIEPFRARAEELAAKWGPRFALPDAAYDVLRDGRVKVA
ncbi:MULTISPECIES: 3-hydroxyacyl-CoA dehydrogenase NAD-binding domain-containing protein [unclassified Haematobacter]|uniref:3-hydroxyacyl-CoA dehydrogenase NAD-binding domain-containing protein n=1 Tax=unclassified Haematobacter TaxID=2640585 RepID=UPI0025BC2749|nr:MULTISPECIES: 3-hydroxyacyl-CoA dehydrogenase NAD-binding domain-containing protein [unclassified Haematobacter]